MRAPGAGPHESANMDRHTRTGRIAQWHLRSVNEAIFQMVARSGGRSILDAGCGEGFVAAYLVSRDSSLQLTGIDLSQEAIVYARRRFSDQVQFDVGSVLALPYADSSFDVVVCSEVLEHLTEWEKAVAELQRVARTHVLITVPHEPYFKAFNDAARLVRFCRDPGHVNFWSWSAFRAMITSRFSSAEFARTHLIYQLALGRL